MIRYFSLCPPAEGSQPNPVAPPHRSSALGDVDCESYEPGHRMHYIQQGRALRSASVKARSVLVDGDVVVLTVEGGAEVEWRHHDTKRLRAVLELFPTSRVVYLEHHAVRLGPYWFNCTPGELAPCRPAHTAPVPDPWAPRP